MSERPEAFIELLPPDVGHNLRHFGPETHHLTGEECHCSPEQVPHEAVAARPATLAASEASRVLGEGSDAQEARVAAYAETALEARCLTLHPERPDRVCRECRDFALTGLRAEVDQLRRFTLDVANGDGFTTQLGGALIVKCDDRGQTDLHRRAESAERARDAALAEVTELRDRLGRVGPAWRRLIDLTDLVEEECDTTASVCHGHDVTDDGECALVADLVSVASALRAALAVPVTSDTVDASPAAEDAAQDCPHAAPFRYCDGCKVSPCPIGLGGGR